MSPIRLGRGHQTVHDVCQRPYDIKAHALTVSFTGKEEQIPFSGSALIGSIKLIIPLPEALKEKVRLVKERDKLIAQQNQLRGQLANEEFLAKAPPQLDEKLKVFLSSIRKQPARHRR